jgi:hypothetical protein
VTSDRQAPPCCQFTARRSDPLPLIKVTPLRCAANSFLLLLGVLLLGACAAESPPRPPRIQRPLAVQDLSAHQVGATIELRFTLPTDATDGESLTKPLEVEIFRDALLPGQKTPPAARASPAPWIVLQGTSLALRTVSGTVVIYADQLSSDDFKRFVGGAFSYEVSCLTRGFRGRPIESVPSNKATLTLVDVPRPVAGLSIEPSQKALNLTWQAPAETLAGEPVGLIESYQVYRRQGGTGNATKPAPYKPVDVAHETSYADSDFTFGHLYSYRVRAVVSKNGSTSESGDSQAVDILPKDVFPPAAPAGLTGLYTSGAVELIWTPNLDPDLAGYNVYRREAGQQVIRLNSELVRSALHRDATVTPGHHYYYRITAEDLSGNESPPSAEVEVELP